MSSTFLVLMSLAMAAVVGVLLIGIFSMAKGGEFNRKYGNRLMQLRVVFQGLALVLFVLALLAGKK